MKLLIICLLLPPALAYAQEAINYGSAGGRVLDPSGAVIQGASVEARHIPTNTALSTTTDSSGRFRFAYLRLGNYRITVRHPGFDDAQEPIEVIAGAAFDLPITLQLVSPSTSQAVSAAQPILETARSQIAETMPQDEIQGLPLNGRSYLDVTLLAPGVSPTNTASTQLFAETSAVPGQGISIGSQRNFSNSFVVDGLSANDDAAGLAGTFYGLDAVNEVQVVSSGGQAEYGRALGGFINVVTNSGTNAFHGNFYGYFRNQRLNSANALTNSKLPVTQTQAGASFGGPVVHDRTFYFANFEQRDLNQDGIVTISPANVAAINARLGAIGYRGAPIATGLYPNPLRTTNFFGKLDHEISARNQLSLRYNLYDVDSDNARGAGALSALSTGAGLNNFDSTLAAGDIANISPRAVNEMRIQFRYSGLQAPVNDPVGPAVSIAGVASFGTLSASPTARLDRLYEGADTVSYQSGAHALRAGVDFLENSLDITYPQSARGSYSFSSLANFEQGLYNNSGFTQSFGNSSVAQTNPNVGFFAQDEWKAAPGLTLNLGIRYDLEFLKTIAAERGAVSPRAGFAWRPFGDTRTVIRGGFGVFYDRIPMRPLANALISSGNTTNITAATFVTASLSPTQTGAPVFPAILSSLPSGVLVNFTTMDRHIRNAYSEQGSIEVERRVGERSTVSASYQHLRGRHLIVDVNENAPACAASGNNNGCRPNSAFGNNKQYSSLGDSKFDALEVSFVERAGKWASLRASYTYSKALDDVGEFFFSAPIDNFNLWKDWGRSDDDQRSRVSFDALVQLGRGFEWSAALQFYSALPLNISTGANTIQGTAARPTLADGSFIARNAGTGFDYFAVNTRLSRTFRLGSRWRVQAIAEAFNALNHRNDMIPNGVFGAGSYPANPLPSFGQATAVGDPRSLQLALRASF